MIEYICLGISVTSIVLGFIALLKQKNYLDPHTKKPTSIELPFFGKSKMVTNFPALIFVFLGFVAVFIILFKPNSKPNEVDWNIQGRFILPEGDSTRVNWLNGVLTIKPKKFETSVYKSGKFQINVKIEEGIKFKDYCEYIEYSSDFGSVVLYPNIDSADSETKTSIIYKPKKIERY